MVPKADEMSEQQQPVVAVNPEGKDRQQAPGESEAKKVKVPKVEKVERPTKNDSQEKPSSQPGEDVFIERLKRDFPLYSEILKLLQEHGIRPLDKEMEFYQSFTG